jgi:hypothetical protein
MTTYATHSRITAAIESGCGLTLTAAEVLAERQEGDALLQLANEAEHALDRIAALEQTVLALDAVVLWMKLEAIEARGVNPVLGCAVIGAGRN